MRKFLQCTIILLLFLSINVSIIQAQTEISPQIYYEGVETGDAGVYTFTYNVKSGSPNITKWYLKGEIFKRIDLNIEVIARDSTNSHVTFKPVILHSPIAGTLEFDHAFDQAAVQIGLVPIPSQVH